MEAVQNQERGGNGISPISSMENGAAVGQLEAAAAPGDGPGEGALLVADHAPNKLLNFRRQHLAHGQVLKFLAQTLTLQRLTPIGVRRTTLRIIPRRRRTVTDRSDVDSGLPNWRV